MSYSSEVLADSPLVYYRLGEASGTSMADSSGNGRTGSYVGSPTLGSTSLILTDSDTSVDLSGSGQYGQYGTPATGLGVTRLTVEAWINSDDVTSVRDIVGRRSSAGGTNEAWQMRTTASGKLDFFIVSGTTYYTSFQSTASLSTGTTYHVVATYDGSNVRLYINGSLDSTFAHTADPNTAVSTAALRIGYSAFAGTPEYFNGRVDEVAVYGAALSGTRIAAHYAAATSLTVAGDPFVSAATALDGTALTAISVAGDPFVSVATMLDGSAAGAPITVGGDPFVSAATMLDGSALTAVSVAGDAFVSAGTFLDGVATLGPVGGDSFVVTMTMLDGGVVVTSATDTSNFFNGRRRFGSAEVEVDVPVTAPPFAATVTRVDKAIAFPEPVLVKGRPT